MTSVRVGDFRPSVNGFHFDNAFARDPIRRFQLGSIATLDIGDASNGLCGGMSYTVRDLWEFGLPPPGDPAPPARGNPRFDYLVNRQIESFANGVVPLRFFKLMDPNRPAREPLWAEWVGRLGIDRHSRTWVMVNVEWPKIRADLDGGSLATLGLVKVVSLDPNELGHNHQVVAYGYDLAGTVVTLRICDPNFAGDETVTLTFDTTDPRGSITPSWSRPPDMVYCFFQTPYTKKDPTAFR
jgi:hypothetical protein